MRKNIVVVDDHEMIRKGIKGLLDSSNLYDVFEASDFEELEKHLKLFHFDLILLDYRLKETTGAEICRRIKKTYPSVKVIIFTAFTEKEVFNDCISSGVEGILLKSTESNSIFDAITQVLDGKTHYDQQLMKYLIQYVHSDQNILNDVEKNIMNLVCEGSRNKEIALEMYMSEKTIRNYLTRIFQKLEVTNRTEAAIKWKNIK